MDFKIGFFFLLTIGFFGFVFATPTGPSSIDSIENTSWSGSASGYEINTSGGVLSSIDVSATVQNPHWKAFVGWVNGEFTLDDSSDNTIYDWSLSSIVGQVYASRSSSVVWGNIGCADASDILAEETEMSHTGEDNISSTFNETNSGTYSIAGVSIGAAECFAANSYVNNNSQSASFEEIILYDNTNLVFATEIEDGATGYDGNDYDFQMIVAENGSSSFVGSTAYYLYVELN